MHEFHDDDARFDAAHENPAGMDQTWTCRGCGETHAVAWGEEMATLEGLQVRHVVSSGPPGASCGPIIWGWVHARGARP